MFEKGDRIVYGQTGVCEVLDITEKALIKNVKRLYYVLKPLYQQNNVIYAPVDSDKVSIRRLMTETEAEELILSLPDISAKTKSSDFTPEDYRAFLNASNGRDLAQLASVIYQKKKAASSQKKKLGFSDERYFHLAESLLFGELAAALSLDPEEIPKYIDKKINIK